MICFLDTSALVKFYVAEAGSEELVARFYEERIVLSRLTYGEIYATLARLFREGLLDPAEHQELCKAFEQDWLTASQIPLSDEVLQEVPGLCRRHPLRGADALQLASAVLLKRSGVEVLFVAGDRRLLAAAEAEGLAVHDAAAV